jgi:hypothetical protein
LLITKWFTCIGWLNNSAPKVYRGLARLPG